MPHTNGLATNKGPKEYQIPSRSYGVTANEAADILIAAKEVMANKQLNKVVMKVLRDKKKAIEKTLK